MFVTCNILREGQTDTVRTLRIMYTTTCNTLFHVGSDLRFFVGFVDTMHSRYLHGKVLYIVHRRSRTHKFAYCMHVKPFLKYSIHNMVTTYQSMYSL